MIEMSKTKFFAILGALVMGGISVAIGIAPNLAEAGHQFN
jgi:hypothetical protein